VIRHSHLAVASALVLLAVASSAGAQQRTILETRQSPPDFNTSASAWASDVCGGKTSFEPQGARYEWTPVQDPPNQYSSLTSASGFALYAHRSGADVPFTHPFGGVDFNYLLVPDTPFEKLLAPKNGAPDEERLVAAAEATQLGIPVGAGYLAVETDIGLVPESYRVQGGDRVAVFGRWIVDCGHDNFLSEIHPPLLTAAARVDAARNVTRVQLLASPYLVSQEFERGGLYQHLEREAALVITPFPLFPFSSQVEAHPRVLPPINELAVFSFLVRAPKPRTSADQKLYVRFHFTARSGVVVQPFWVDDETIGVICLLTDQLTMAPLPKSGSWDVSGVELSRLHAGAGAAWQGITGLVAFFDPLKNHILNKGIRTTLYHWPVAPDLTNVPVTEGIVASIPWQQNPVAVNDNQPFPLIGWMEVMWKPSTARTVASQLSYQDIRAILEASVPQAGSPGALRPLDRIARLNGLLERLAPAPKDLPNGAWAYAIRTSRGRSERGRLWLRVSGRLVQGLLETANGNSDELSGSFDGRQLLLTRNIQGEHRSQRLRLERRGAQLVGVVEVNDRPIGRIELVR